ncbi:MAG: hypothetical protein AB7S26_42550 [Sandaracinaceae bacterium]
MRAVPRTDPSGAPFLGPGVDLRGSAATEVLAAAAPVRAWLEAREPGITLRSLSVDRTRDRVLVTLEQARDRPRALRFDGSAAAELIAAATEIERRLAPACAAQLARRSSELT